MFKPQCLWKLSLVLSLIGLGLAGYLCYLYLFPANSGLCNIGPTVNCEAVTQGSLSLFLGLPVPLVGLIGYGLILYATLIKAKKFHLFMTGFGTIFCLRITFLEIFSQKVYCPICLLCQIVMLLLFFLSWKLFRKPLPQTD